MQLKIRYFNIFISMVVIFQNGGHNIHVLISLLLISIEKIFVFKYTFSGQRQD